MKEVDGGFVLDFDCFIDDLEVGLVVIKGIVLIVEVLIFKIDEFIMWC